MDPVISSSNVLVSPLDSLADSIACSSSSILEDSVGNPLMLTNHSVTSSLDITQASVGLNELEGRGSPGVLDMGTEENAYCRDLDGQPIADPDLSGLQSSYMLVNLPSSTQTSLATTTLMPILVLSTGGPTQKGSPDAGTGLMLDRPQQDLRQLFRLRDLAHANLICATQESIAKSYGMSNPPAEAKSYKCEECGHVYKSSSHYRYHCETHKGNKVLKCPVEGCSKRFAWPAHLKYHTRTHVNDRPYSCTMDRCNKTFYTVQSLHVHMRTHTGHKPFKCPEEDCGKSFTTAGNLKNHFRIHTGERPFACNNDGCVQTFTEHSSLRKHKLTHTGEKPYECDICFRVFSQIGSRNTHQRRHHSLSKTRKVETSSMVEDIGGTMEDRGRPQSEKRAQLEARTLLDEQVTGQNEIGLGEITLPRRPTSSLHTLTVNVANSHMNMTDHSPINEHHGISLSHSLLGGVALNPHQQDSSSEDTMQSGDHGASVTMLSNGSIVSHDSITLSHSILEGSTMLEQNESCKSNSHPHGRRRGNNSNSVIVLPRPEDHSQDDTLGGMMLDESQYPGSHQQDMVYNNAMLQSAATVNLSDQDHGGHDVNIASIEVSNDHHDLQDGDIVITW